jgi:hypothetical protein
MQPKEKTNKGSIQGQITRKQKLNISLTSPGGKICQQWRQARRRRDNITVNRKEHYDVMSLHDVNTGGTAATYLAAQITTHCQQKSSIMGEIQLLET